MIFWDEEAKIRQSINVGYYDEVTNSRAHRKMKQMNAYHTIWFYGLRHNRR